MTDNRYFQNYFIFYRMFTSVCKGFPQAILLGFFGELIYILIEFFMILDDEFSFASLLLLPLCYCCLFVGISHLAILPSGLSGWLWVLCELIPYSASISIWLSHLCVLSLIYAVIFPPISCGSFSLSPSSVASPFALALSPPPFLPPSLNVSSRDSFLPS